MSESIGVGDHVDGKYRILRLIGEGGWGIVFEAENARTLKRVALKILRTNSSVTAEIQQRFEREAQAAGRIGSEHIVEVFDLGTLADGTSYMVMELLAGEELSSRIRALGKIEAVVAVKLIVQLLDGLGAAHAAGILHRDLKPENLFLVPTRNGGDFVKILDFGISKFSNVPAVSATMTGAVLGSPFYMAPEQARGLKQIDARTDLYAVGTVLYECVTGRVPFEGDNFNDLMFRIVLAPRPNPIELVPDLDPGLVPIIMKAIAVEPADRYKDATAFRTALVEWLDTKGVTSVRPPELRRGLSKTQTPRSSDGLPSGAMASGQAARMTPDTSRTRRDKPEWSDATVAAVSGLGANDTPVASSATLDSKRVSRKKRAMWIGSAAVLVAIVGVTAAQRAKPREPSVATEPTAMPVETAAHPEPTPTPAASSQPVAPATATAAPETPDAHVAEIDDTAYTATAVAAHSASTHGTHGSHAARDSGAPAASPAAPLPDAPKPAASAKPKPADTVEGREIRTNL